MGVSVENADYTFRVDHLRQTQAAVKLVSGEPLIGRIGKLNLAGIDWVVVGGESGPGARPMDPLWVTEVRDGRVDEGVAFFFKQWGGTRRKRAGRSLEGRAWDQMPEVSVVRTE